MVVFVKKNSFKNFGPWLAAGNMQMFYSPFPLGKICYQRGWTGNPDYKKCLHPLTNSLVPEEGGFTILSNYILEDFWFNPAVVVF